METLGKPKICRAIRQHLKAILHSNLVQPIGWGIRDDIAQLRNPAVRRLKFSVFVRENRVNSWGIDLDAIRRDFRKMIKAGSHQGARN